MWFLLLHIKYEMEYLKKDFSFLFWYDQPWLSVKKHLDQAAPLELFCQIYLLGWLLVLEFDYLSHLSSLLCFCHQAKLWCMERAGQRSVSFKIYTSLVTNLMIVGKGEYKSIFIRGENILSFQFEKPIEEGFWSYLPRKRVIYIHLNNRASPSESP